MSSASDRLKHLSDQLNSSSGASSSNAQLDISPLETMKRERAKITFNVKELTQFLDGSKEMTEASYHLY